MTTQETTPDYQAVKHLSSLYETGTERNISGLVFTKEVASKHDQIQVAQHNFIIQYLIQMNERIERLQNQIHRIEHYFETQNGKSISPTLETLINKLDTLSISGKQPHKDTNPFVFPIMEDPKPLNKDKGKETSTST